MTDIADATTYACDACSVPVVLTDLVPFKGQHVCRRCFDDAHSTGRSTARAEGNKLARSDTRFGDWPGPTEDPTS